jgi:(E)-4-hydroxy-3-methylbut-2-enyl-diphosphate synthase
MSQINVDKKIFADDLMIMKRRKTRKVWVGNVAIGGGAPISVQSMTKTDTRDVVSTIKQIRKLEKASCEIIRVAVPDMESANALPRIKQKIHIPLVADVHFDYRLALKAVEFGVDKLRINPGNIGARWKVEQIVKAASERKIPIRIGVNAGSVPRDILAKYKKASPQALVESAMRQIRILEGLNFNDIVISVKAFDVPTTIQAYELISKKVDYPLHLGITEAGLPQTGAIRSALGIGLLLAQGIGDTIRVSLTGDPVEEIRVGQEILKSLNLREFGPTIISCPTCGRCEIDLIPMVKEVEKKMKNIKAPITVAVMGCVVNGPGEARYADVGIAGGMNHAVHSGGKGYGLLFRKGKIIGKVKEEDLVKALLDVVEQML